MKITLIGPRSVGKSTVGKALSKRIKIRYIEGDKRMHKELKKHGGLDKVIKSGKTHLIEQKAVPLIVKILQNKKIILDLAGGAISSKKHKKVSERIIKIITEKSCVIGLLPFKNNKESIEFLFNRERKRKHFKKEDKRSLKNQVKKDYLKLKPKLMKHSNIIIYTKDKAPSQIVNEIIKKVSAHTL